MKLFRRWPVRWRIAGVSAGLTLIILVCFAMIVGRLMTNRLSSDFESDLQNKADRLATALRLEDAPSFAKIMAALGDGVVRFVDIEGDPIQRTQETPSLGPPQQDMVQIGDFEVAASQVSTNSLTRPATYVQFAQTRDSVDATIDRVWLLLAGGVLGGSVLAALAGLAVAGRAMRPISSLTAAAREVATTRDPSRRLPMPDTDDEVAELAKTLDLMLRELDAARSESQQLMQAQRDFVADASHELRTPLTSILANLELLEARLEDGDGDPEAEEMVAGALGSSRRMRRLVADLLLLARADAGRSGPRGACDLVEIASEALAEVRPVAGAHELGLDAEGPVVIEGNPDDLHRLILNLLENGVSHTPDGTRIAASVTAADDAAVIEVSDDGPGIPDSIGDQIFSRFVRADGPTDVVAHSGTGLGLAIVKAVASAHGGEVELGRSSAGGARLVIRLPLGEPASTPHPAPVG